MKANKELGSPGNKGNKNERNEVLGKKMKDSITKVNEYQQGGIERQQKKTSTGKVVEYIMKGSNKWNTGKIMSAQPKLSGKYNHEI